MRERKFNRLLPLIFITGFLMLGLISTNQYFLNQMQVDLQESSPIRSSDAPIPFNYFVNFTEPQDINTYNTSAHHNISTNGYDLGASSPYPLAAVLVSNILLLPNYFIISANITVHATLPTNTALKIYLTNDYFFTEVEMVNDTGTMFATYGRQLAYKIILESTSSDVTPTVHAVTINSTGLVYEDTSFTYNKEYHYLPRANNAEDKEIGEMSFTYSAQLITYGLTLKYWSDKINDTHEFLSAYISLSTKSGSYIYPQINYLVYDLNLTINGVHFRFFGRSSAQTPYISFGWIGDFDFFNFTIKHDRAEKICIDSTIKFHCWNSHGGDTNGTEVFNTELYQYFQQTGIPGFEFITIFLGIIAIIGLISVRKHKF